MGAGLYGYDGVFTSAMDEFFGILGAEGECLRSDWLSDDPAVAIDDARRSQPLLLAVDHALAQALMSHGVSPAALLGHSAGELAAAVLANVLSLADAARLVVRLARRVADTPPGGMLAVAASAATVEPYLGSGVVVAAVNARNQVLLAGTDQQLTALEETLRGQGFTCRRVSARSAFHSPVVAPAVAGVTTDLAGIRLSEPEIPIYSAYTAAKLTAETACDPGFWASHLTRPVLFADALSALLEAGDVLLVECGPGCWLSTLARRHPNVRAGRSGVTHLLPDKPAGSEADRMALEGALDLIRGEGHRLGGRALPGSVR
jgi:acyl transferase domain-containing protein